MVGLIQVLINRDNAQVVDNRGMKWASLHDGEFLYFLIFAERGVNQTPQGDSPESLLYNDDGIDIYWDGDNSKGASYDGINDHHVIIGLLDDDGNENRSRLNLLFVSAQEISKYTKSKLNWPMREFPWIQLSGLNSTSTMT